MAQGLIDNERSLLVARIIQFIGVESRMMEKDGIKKLGVECICHSGILNF